MKTKQNYLKVSLLLAALTLLPLAPPAMAGDYVPFNGVEVGTYTAGPFDFPFFTVLNAGEGEATQLGHYTVTGSIVINVLSGSVTGTFTLTAAKRDKLFLTFAGEAPPPAVKETVADITVTDGTGRFQGATGSWVQTSQFAFVFGGPTGSINPYVAVLEGTLATPGANKK